MQAAQGRVASAQSADQRHAQAQAADALTRPPDQPAPPDTYHSDTAAAVSSFSQAHRAWTDCLAGARALKADLPTAIPSSTPIMSIARSIIWVASGRPALRSIGAPRSSPSLQAPVRSQTPTFPTWVRVPARRSP